MSPDFEKVPARKPVDELHVVFLGNACACALELSHSCLLLLLGEGLLGGTGDSLDEREQCVAHILQSVKAIAKKLEPDERRDRVMRRYRTKVYKRSKSGASDRVDSSHAGDACGVTERP
jgi:hypothetical protein